jgi:hypothetical protein
MQKLSPQEIQELITNEPENKHEIESPSSANSENSNDSMEDSPDTGETTQSEIMILEELVYPHEMTVDMLEQYRHFSALNLTANMVMVFRKLLRSAKFWRLELEQYKWLIKRMV